MTRNLGSFVQGYSSAFSDTPGFIDGLCDRHLRYLGISCPGCRDSHTSDLHALCIEPDLVDPAPVSESLDWSAPGLLAELGLFMQRPMAFGHDARACGHSTLRRNALLVRLQEKAEYHRSK